MLALASPILLVYKVEVEWVQKNTQDDHSLFELSKGCRQQQETQWMCHLLPFSFCVHRGCFPDDSAIVSYPIH